MKSSVLPKGIWVLGFVSLLMDVSSEMVHGLLPVFLVSVLGSSYTTVGFIEGFGEGIATMMKVFSGPLSDRLQKRKPLVLLGYSMGAISKPFFALATGADMVLGARLFDRIGKGIRGAPRDALIADIAPPESRGAAFGLRQSLDTIGAVIGPLIAMLLMSLSGNNYRLVFGLAVIPGLLCVLLIIAGVREPEVQSNGTGKMRNLFAGMGQFPKSFWIAAIAGGLSQLARFSEAFLILRATDLGLAMSLAPLILIAMNVIYSASAYPLGRLSDRWQRKHLLTIGFLVLVAADLCLALTSGLVGIFIGIVLWGLHLGFTQGTMAAMVADTCPVDKRGTAYGVFQIFTALALLAASGIAGMIWDRFGAQTTFLVAASFALLGAFFPISANLKRPKSVG